MASTSAMSQFFVLSPRGDTIISRECKYCAALGLYVHRPWREHTHTLRISAAPSSVPVLQLTHLTHHTHTLPHLRARAQIAATSPVEPRRCSSARSSSRSRSHPCS
jgi:hypothetical protein